MLKLITAAFSQKSSLLITNANSPLGRELFSQLAQYPYIDVKTEASSSDFTAFSTVSTIIHLPSNHPQLLAEILGLTSSLHKLLESAKAFHAKFILVVPNTSDHLYQTAIQMVIHFCKNYKLAYDVFEIPPSLPVADSAEAILKKVIYKHKKRLATIPVQTSLIPPRPIPIPTPPPPSIPTPIPAVTQLPVIVQSPPPPVPIPSPVPVSKPHISKPKMPRPTLKLPTISLPTLSLPHIPSRWLLTIFALIIAPWTVFIISNIFLAISAICSYKSLTTNQLTRASSCAQSARILQLGSRYSSYLAIGSKPLITFAGYPEAETTNFITSASKSISLASKINTASVDYAENFLTSEDASSLVSTSDMLSDTTALVESLATLQNDLRSFYAASPRPPDGLNTLAAKIVDMRDISSKAHLAVGDIMPIFESPTAKKIAVLVQDDTELRPSGGFIDSIILLTVENFKITSWRVVTAQFLDQQLLGAVEPPADFKSATGQIQWYLRDSNWDIDYRNNASRASWFIQKELNETPDVVVAINMQTLGKASEVLGPIKFGLAGVTLTSENMTSEYHSYLKSHADTNDFLKTISEKLLDRSKSATRSQIDQLTSLLSTDMRNHQVLLALPDKSTPGLDASGWNGGVVLPKCRSALLCVVDMAYIVESNIGINKADRYIERNWESEIVVSTTGLKTLLTGTYRNTSTENAWPAGIHKNYVRVVLPPSALIESIKIGDRELKTTETTMTNENGLAVVGFRVETLPSSTSVITISTSQSMPLTSGRTHYQLDMPLQPGKRMATPTKVSIKYPTNWFATSYIEPEFASAGELEYNLETNHGTAIDVDFAITEKPTP